MILLFSVKFLNETRVVLLLSINKFYTTLVSVGMNLKLLQNFLLSLKTSNTYLEMSSGSLSSREDLILPGVSF